MTIVFLIVTFALVVVAGLFFMFVKDKDLANRYKSWLMDYPSTNGRIVASTHTAVALAWIVTLAVLLGWEPTDLQIKILYGVGLGLLIMQGIDVAQFTSKRFSDAGREAVKQGTGAVISQSGGKENKIVPTVATQEFPMPTPLPTPVMPVVSSLAKNDDAEIRAELAAAGRDAVPVETPHVPRYVDGKLQPDD